MLIRKKKTKSKQPEKPQPAYNPEIGSGWYPGKGTNSWLLPDWTRSPLEKGSDGVTRPTRR